ncbi:MAG: glycosyltransferase family 4 protein [Chloroflexota bacterium]|nr:glycosyltransferase family 4 protein [Chloroflexota bacterium]
MRILLLTAYFPPDTGSAAHLFYELGTALVRRGHQVTVVTGMPGYHAQGSLQPYAGQRRLYETVNGIHVVRVVTPLRSSHSMLGRALWHFGAALTFFVAGVGLPPHDAVVLYSPPLPLGLAAWGWHRLRGLPFVLNVQDLFPRSAIDLGLLRHPLLIQAFDLLEQFLYRRASWITVHSPGNRHHVIARGGDPRRVTVVPNWVDIDFIRPGPRENAFRTRHRLGDGFIASFAGVLGYSQDIDVVLEAAALTAEKGEITWLIVGDGVHAPRLRQKAALMALDNVRFLPMQPRESYPELLHASDVGLATLRSDVTTPVVPSKILSIMAAGLPVVTALPLDGDASRLIAEARCGICLPPGDARALADAVLKLWRNRSLRQRLGECGRRYVEQRLSLDACVARYEDLLERVSEYAGPPHLPARQPGRGGSHTAHPRVGESARGGFF